MFAGWIALAAGSSCKRAEPEPSARIEAEGPISVDALTADSLAARIERAGFRIAQRSPDGSLFVARHRGGRETGVAPEISVVFFAKGGAAALLPSSGYAVERGSRAELRLRVEGADDSALQAALGAKPDESHDAAAKRFLAAVLAGTEAAAIEPLPKPEKLPTDFRVPLPEDHRVVRVYGNAIHFTSAQSVDQLRSFFERALGNVGCERSVAPLGPENNAGVLPPLPRAALAWKGGAREVARIDLRAIDDGVTVIELRAKRGFEPAKPDAKSSALPVARELPAISKPVTPGDADERCVTLQLCGRHREGAHACAEASRRAPGNPMHRYNLACALAGAGDPEGALDALKQLQACSDPACTRLLTNAKGDPDFETLSKLPRFRAVVGSR
jgi:hypothetical protein